VVGGREAVVVVVVVVAVVVAVVGAVASASAGLISQPSDEPSVKHSAYGRLSVAPSPGTMSWVGHFQVSYVTKGPCDAPAIIIPSNTRYIYKTVLPQSIPISYFLNARNVAKDVLQAR
jgi:hypothetical protein